MAKFPVDASIRKVIKAFESLGFRLVREGNHIAMVRENHDGWDTDTADDAQPSADKRFDATHHPHAIGDIQRRVSESLQRCLSGKHRCPFFCWFSLTSQQGLVVRKCHLWGGAA